MAGERDTDASGSTRLQRRIRSVTPLSSGHPDEEMEVIGWGIALGALLLLMPLLPFILIVWLISKIAERLSP